MKNFSLPNNECNRNFSKNLVLNNYNLLLKNKFNFDALSI